MGVQAYDTDDCFLFERLRNGDTGAFECAFRRYAPRLEAFARKYTIDATEAEDIVQNVFLKLWERRELLESVSLTSYLFMSTKNGCLNYLKHRQVADAIGQRIPDNEVVEQLYMIDFVSDPSSLLQQKELTDSINRIMEELPPKCKKAFVLSRLNGFKNREIASEMNITEKVVEKHITRALKRFREGLRYFALYVWILIWI